MIFVIVNTNSYVVLWKCDIFGWTQWRWSVCSAVHMTAEGFGWGKRLRKSYASRGQCSPDTWCALTMSVEFSGAIVFYHQILKSIQKSKCKQLDNRNKKMIPLLSTFSPLSKLSLRGESAPSHSQRKCFHVGRWVMSMRPREDSKRMWETERRTVMRKRGRRWGGSERRRRRRRRWTVHVRGWWEPKRDEGWEEERRKHRSWGADRQVDGYLPARG